MSTLKIGLPCLRVVEDAFEVNLRNVTQVLEGHAGEDIDIFVFGEANLTGLDTENFNSRSFRDPHEIQQQVNSITIRFETSVYVGFIERDEHRHYLTHLLSSEGRTCGLQRKVFPRDPTKPSVYWSGRRIHAIPFRAYRVVILSCVDWLLPEPIAMATMQGPDLILAPTEQRYCVPHNWPILDHYGRTASSLMHAPLLVGFNSESVPDNEDDEVYAALAYDCTGKQILQESKKIHETTFHRVEVKLERIGVCGGFEVRKQYLDFNEQQYGLRVFER